MLARLAQNLNRNVVGNSIVFDETAHKIEFSFGRTRKADFDFFESDFHKQVEKRELLLDAHWIHQGLVSISQIHGTPNRRVRDLRVRPFSVLNVHLRIWNIFSV